MKFETIYASLYQLIPDFDQVQEYKGLEAAGFMKLGVDILHRDAKGTVVALSHYYKHPSGDMIPDPDMVVYVDREKKQAQALSYQDMMIYTEVYPNTDTFYGVLDNPDLAAQKSLNAFLAQWLKNLLAQGHK